MKVYRFLLKIKWNKPYETVQCLTWLFLNKYYYVWRFIVIRLIEEGQLFLSWYSRLKWRVFSFRILECCTNGNKENLCLSLDFSLQNSFLKQWIYFIIYGSYKRLFPPGPINGLAFYYQSSFCWFSYIYYIQSLI